MIREYHYWDGNEQGGPVSLEQLRSLELNPDALIWTEGFLDWKPLHEVAELKPQPTKRKKKLSKVVITIGIVAGAIAILLVFAWFVFGKFTGDELIPVKSADKWGYINQKGEYVINPQFDDVEFFNNGLAKVISSDGKIGYIDKSGRFAVTTVYKQGTEFSDGLAFVAAEGGYPTCIDEKANIKFELKEAEYVYGFSEDLAMFVTKDKKYGFIDKTGKTVINAQFEGAVSFSSGFAAIVTDGKIGFINKDGKIVINPQFDDVENFSDGKAAFFNGDKWGYIDTKGSYVINPQFDYAGKFNEGLAMVKRGNSWGFIDKNGSYVINPQFDNVEPFNEGLALFRQGDLWGYINKKGKFEINPQFKEAASFVNGLAIVKQGASYGYIDKNGQYVINPQFEAAYNFNGSIAPVRSAGKWGFIDKKGQYAVNPQFDEVKFKPDISHNTTNKNSENFVKNDYYDASEFVRLFFEKANGDEFDGINASTTLVNLSEHPIYGAYLNDRSQYIADVRKTIAITDDIYITDVLFHFDNALYRMVDSYNTDYWGNTYRSGTRKEYDYNVIPSAIRYLLDGFHSGDVRGKGSVVAAAMKNEIERRYKLQMEGEAGKYFAYQDNGKCSFALVYAEYSITFYVAFNKTSLQNILNN